jgi:hypothetical protein
MIATVRLGPEELADVLRDYCNSRGYIYFQHGLTEEGLVELHIELPAAPLAPVPVVRYAAPESVATPPAATYVAPAVQVPEQPQLSLDLTTILDPSSTPDGTTASRSPDDELTAMFRKKLPAESQRVNPPIVRNPADEKAPF